MATGSKDLLSYTLFLLIPLFAALATGTPGQQNSSRAATTPYPKTGHHLHHNARIGIENSIRTGLKLRALPVCYQPKIDLEGEQPTSFAALIRGRKHGTVIGPNDCISIAEESGLLDEMSLYVPAEVCILPRQIPGPQPPGFADQRHEGCTPFPRRPSSRETHRNRQKKCARCR